MKSKWIKVTVVLICMALFSGLLGCKKQPDHSAQERVEVVKMTQEERISLVVRYLKDQYGIDAEITEVKKRQINSFSSETHYYAIAKCEDGARIYCWVSEQGEVKDSKFVNDLSNDINCLFEGEIAGELENYKVVCSCTLNNPAQKTWSALSVREMLQTEDITTQIRIFVSSGEREAAEELVKNQFNGAFAFAKGACYIYFVDDAKNVDIQTMDLTQYDLQFVLEED